MAHADTATPPPPATSPRPARIGQEPGPVARITLADGRVFQGSLALEAHRRHHLGMLHRHTDGLVEIAAGARRQGQLHIRTRKDPGHYLPGGARHPEWLEAMVALVDDHVRRGDEVFVGAAERHTPTADPRRPGAVLGGAGTVRASRWLWVDVDQPAQLGALWAFCQRFPAHALVETAGSGGYHAYWQLDQRLPADSGEPVAVIEDANGRLAHHLAGDPACRNRDRVLRVAGSQNHKTGGWARLAHADFCLAPYPLDVLVAQLPRTLGDTPSRRRAPRPGLTADRYRSISPPEYFRELAGMSVGPSGIVSCPHPDHRDEHPSCRVWPDPARGFYCFACGAGGSIYDLASILAGGPHGPALRGSHFARARDLVQAVFGVQYARGRTG